MQIFCYFRFMSVELNCGYHQFNEGHGYLQMSYPTDF